MKCHKHKFDLSFCFKNMPSFLNITPSTIFQSVSSCGPPQIKLCIVSSFTFWETGNCFILISLLYLRVLPLSCCLAFTLNLLLFIAPQESAFHIEAFRFFPLSLFSSSLVLLIFVFTSTYILYAFFVYSNIKK